MVEVPIDRCQCGWVRAAQFAAEVIRLRIGGLQWFVLIVEARLVLPFFGVENFLL